MVWPVPFSEGEKDVSKKRKIITFKEGEKGNPKGVGCLKKIS